MKFWLYFIFFLLSTTVSYAQITILQGRVVDAENRPLAQVNITVAQPNLHTISAKDGTFQLSIPLAYKEVAIKFATSGKQSITEQVALAQYGTFLEVILFESSLTLEGVTLTYEQNSSQSNSAITYGKESIEQAQAFSLMDVINLMPGKATVAPSLNSAQLINLRGYSGGQSNLQQFQNNNSMGVAIVVDGVQQFNDANMQGRSLSKWGITNGAIGQADGSQVNNTYAGVDLRDIPTENIEKIEIVQGVASAKYGEMTDGAVIIERIAGRTPFILSAHINAGSTNAYISKGFKLSPKLGAVNLGFNYLHSNDDPRDKVRSYSRYAPSLMWTLPIGTYSKNTLSVDYNTRGDEIKQDPDDDRQTSSYNKSRNIKIANRLRFVMHKKYIQSLEILGSFSSGYQETYSQYYLNSYPKPMATKDTTGIYEGFYIPGSYLAQQMVLGQPITATANINAISLMRTAGIHHRWSYGVSYNYQNNGGKGIAIDPERPRFTSGYQFERPYDYSYVPDVHNWGVYLEDQISTSVAQRPLNVTVGFRNDWQNGYSTFQPRLNVNYQVARQLQFNYAYGVAAKGPSLAYRFPVPTFMDIPLLQLYSGIPEQNVFVVFTDKVAPDNSQLKPQKTIQQEAGFKWTNKLFTTSLFGYYKKTLDGFTSETVFTQYLLPEYDYQLKDGAVQYWQTGDSSMYGGAGYNKVINGLNSSVYGLEWIMQTQKIKSINTSFNLSAVYNYGNYQNKAKNIQSAAMSFDNQAAERAWYAVYPNADYESHYLMTKVGAITHWSALGFVLAVNADVFWMNTTKRNAYAGTPIGYVNNNMEFVPIENFDANNPIYGNLALEPVNLIHKKLQKPYGYLNLSIAKEIKKNIRISINAYNFLNLRYQQATYYTSGSITYESFINPFSISAGITLKL